MSDDETRPIGSEAPTPPPEQQAPQEASAAPAYAMPAPAGYPAGYPTYAQQRPRFVDQVLGMRAVIAVAIACLLIGGLSGAVLGRASAGDDGDRFGGPGGFFQQGGGTLPNSNGAPNQQFGQGSNGG